VVVVSSKFGCCDGGFLLEVEVEVGGVSIDDEIEDEDDDIEDEDVVAHDDGCIHCCEYIMDVMVDMDDAIGMAMVSGQCLKSNVILGGRTNPALINVVPPIPYPVLMSIIRYHSYQKSSRLDTVVVVALTEETEDAVDVDVDADV
jgi:hypothetical protein